MNVKNAEIGSYLARNLIEGFHMMMFWKYALVFLGGFLVDVFPIPLPPAFTVMIFLQIVFHLNIWWVISVGVLGSILGRYTLAWYIPKLAHRIFNPAKNEDVIFLGQKLKLNKRKGQALILVYSLMPLPTTPLFIAAGMARMKPIRIIAPFTIGKFISDAIAVFMGKYAAENTKDLAEGMVSWQSITGLALGFLLVFAIIFVDWMKLYREKKFTLKFNVWR
jgi:membrane protein YqaA with SNARE-associated domain